MTFSDFTSRASNSFCTLTFHLGLLYTAEKRSMMILWSESYLARCRHRPKAAQLLSHMLVGPMAARALALILCLNRKRRRLQKSPTNLENVGNPSRRFASSQPFHSATRLPLKDFGRPKMRLFLRLSFGLEGPSSLLLLCGRPDLVSLTVPGV